MTLPLAAAPDPALILLLAVLVDAAVGDPPWLYARLPHPVAAIGGAVGWLDRWLNHEGLGDAARRLAGIAALVAVTGLAAGIGWALTIFLHRQPFGWIVEAVLMSTLIAQRGLYDHVRAVAEALAREGLHAGRAAVAHIVGRDPDRLDEAGVARAALESLAENFSDGVAAPLFWGLLLGLPGLLAYKAINTADSMIGHRTARHRAFGWAAARIDDAVNLVPARIAGLLLAAAALVEPGADAAAALRAMWRDAPRHRSPNAGWPEATLAGALGLALAGPRRYGGESVADAWMGDGGRRDAGPADIGRGLRLYVVACALAAGLVAVVAII